MTTDWGPRCYTCGRKLADHVSRPWKLLCSKCSSWNTDQVHIRPIDKTLMVGVNNKKT